MQAILVNEGHELAPYINGTHRSIVLFYANWCPFCIRFLSVFKKCVAAKTDCFAAQDDREVLSDQYEIDIIPTVLCFENGAVVARLDGKAGVGLTETQLVEFLQKVEK